MSRTVGVASVKINMDHRFRQESKDALLLMLKSDRMKVFSEMQERQLLFCTHCQIEYKPKQISGRGGTGDRGLTRIITCSAVVKKTAKFDYFLTSELAVRINFSL